MGEGAVLNLGLFYVVWFMLVGVLTLATPGFGVLALLLGLLVRASVR